MEPPLIFSPSCWVFFEQLSRAEEKMNGLEGCYCERTCSVKGVIYREDEGWTDGCRNCTCSVGFRTREGRRHVSLHARSLWTRFGLFREKSASRYECSVARDCLRFCICCYQGLKAFVLPSCSSNEGVCGCVLECWQLLFSLFVTKKRVCRR